MNASGELYSSRDAMGATTRCIMWIAVLESVWISSGVEGGVMTIAAAMAIASILVELNSSYRTRPRKSMGVFGPWVKVPAKAPFALPSDCMTDPSV